MMPAQKRERESCLMSNDVHFSILEKKCFRQVLTCAGVVCTIAIDVSKRVVDICLFIQYFRCYPMHSCLSCKKESRKCVVNWWNETYLVCCWKIMYLIEWLVTCRSLLVLLLTCSLNLVSPKSLTLTFHLSSNSRFRDFRSLCTISIFCF